MKRRLMTKDEFHELYEVFEYEHEQGKQIMVVNKESNLIEYIDEGESLDRLYNKMYFNRSVENKAEVKPFDRIELDDFYPKHFDTWADHADIYHDEVIQWNTGRDWKIFTLTADEGYVRYSFGQVLDGLVYTSKLYYPTEKELLNGIYAYIYRYIDSTAKEDSKQDS